MPTTNQQLASLLQSIANQLEARRDNPHRIRAYRRAADMIRSLSDDIATVAVRGELRAIQGIGKDLAAKIEEFLKTGTIHIYEQLRRPLPPEIADWLSLPGLSEPAVQELYFRLGIRSLEDLESLVRSHLLRTLPGVTAPEEELLVAIQKLRGEIKAPTSDVPQPER